MSSTPEKIESSLTAIEKDSQKLDQPIAQYSKISEEIYDTLFASLARFDDVPVERLRKIRSYIEEVQSNRDNLVEASQSLEKFAVSAKDRKDSISKLRKYYDENYSVSVQKRIDRDR